MSMSDWGGPNKGKARGRGEWDRIEGNWKQIKGKIKEQWGRLTNDDLDKIEGSRDRLEGKIQERYGLEEDRARQEIEDWLKKHPED